MTSESEIRVQKHIVNICTVRVSFEKTGSSLIERSFPSGPGLMVIYSHLWYLNGAQSLTLRP